MVRDTLQAPESKRKQALAPDGGPTLGRSSPLRPGPCRPGRKMGRPDSQRALGGRGLSPHFIDGQDLAQSPFERRPLAHTCGIEPLRMWLLAGARGRGNVIWPALSSSRSIVRQAMPWKRPSAPRHIQTISNSRETRALCEDRPSGRGRDMERTPSGRTARGRIAMARSMASTLSHQVVGGHGQVREKGNDMI